MFCGGNKPLVGGLKSEGKSTRWTPPHPPSKKTLGEIQLLVGGIYQGDFSLWERMRKFTTSGGTLPYPPLSRENPETHI